MAISQRLRFEIFRRDNHACRYCGATAPNAKLTVDHVIPRTLGGTDDPSNLVAACSGCNAGKSSTQPESTVVEDVQSRTFEWRAALDEAAQGFRAEVAAESRAVDIFDSEWRRWTYGDDKNEVPRPDNWRASVLVWLGRGMPIDLICESIPIAMQRKSVRIDSAWRYTCGVCWHRLRELEARAEQLVSESMASDVGLRESLEDEELFDMT